MNGVLLNHVSPYKCKTKSMFFFPPVPPHSQRVQVLLELAACLVPYLDDEAISLLYRTVKPLVRDDVMPQLQKRVYKVRAANDLRSAHKYTRRHSQDTK